MLKSELQNKVWWSYVHEDLRELILESALLVDRVGSWNEKFHDYAFVVFSAAKAYEGFLKTLFLDLGFITTEEFYGKRFRIGKSLNPALEENRERDSVYDRIVNFCGGKALADEMWETWRVSRNLLFHWFPDEKNAIDFVSAQNNVEKIINTIDLAFKECKIVRK